MENLGVPIEIFLEIIKLLSTRQLLVCKAVNKTWNWIISREFRFENLVISTTSHFNRRWYVSYEFACPDDLIKISGFDSSVLRQINIPGLKRLFLYSDKKYDTSESRLFFPEFSVGNLVNHLKKLEQLEMFGLKNRAKEDRIALESLKTLYIGRCLWNDLSIDCPNLINLKLKNPKYEPGYRKFNRKIWFKYPESVRSLEVLELDISEIMSWFIHKFENLERIGLPWNCRARRTYSDGNYRFSTVGLAINYRSSC